MSKFIPVLIKWPAEALARLDETAKSRGLTRAAAVREAVAEWVARHRP